jgi:hypothetical protein
MSRIRYWCFPLSCHVPSPTANKLSPFSAKACARQLHVPCFTPRAPRAVSVPRMVPNGEAVPSARVEEVEPARGLESLRANCNGAVEAHRRHRRKYLEVHVDAG